MKTYRLTDRNHPQANQEFYGSKFFVNKLGEYVEVDAQYQSLITEHELKDMTTSLDFEEASQEDFMLFLNDF